MIMIINIGGPIGRVLVYSYCN